MQRRSDGFWPPAAIRDYRRRSLSKVLTTLAVTVLAMAAAPGIAQTKPAAAAAQPETRAAFTAEIQAKFKSLDSDNDGSIEKAEVDAANTTAAQHAEARLNAQMDAEFAKLDTNKDKQISLSEFKAAAPKARPVPAAQVIGRVDTNKDQKLSFAEFSATPLKAFDQLDTNKDGTISVAEQQAAASR
jgi:hypothetical protein